MTALNFGSSISVVDLYDFGMANKHSGSERILLILDLDETLIHARETALDRPADFHLAQYHVYLRPFLIDFIGACASSFELAVWSSASDNYVRAITNQIFPDPNILHFIWGRSRCTIPRGFVGIDGLNSQPASHLDYVKPIKKVTKLGWAKERILIVDDTPFKSSRNYGNAIYPTEFEGDMSDNELLRLATYLESIKDCPNVRTLEKRNWREGV